MQFNVFHIKTMKAGEQKKQKMGRAKKKQMKRIMDKMKKRNSNGDDVWLSMKYERKYKIWNEIKIHSNTNDGHLSAAKYHTTGETIIQTWIACRVLSVSFNRNIYLANGWAISCLHENGALKNHWTSSNETKWMANTAFCEQNE